MFGTPLGMDEFTAKMTKMKFARVCTEVTTEFKHPESIPVDIETKIEELEIETMRDDRFSTWGTRGKASLY